MTNADGNNLAYDDNGNMTTGINTSLEYNWDNKIRQVTVDQETVEFKYDPLGNRIFKQHDDGQNTVTRKCIVDIVGDLPIVLLEIDTSDDSIEKTYIYANSQILAQHDGSHSSSRYFHLCDRLGSTRMLMDTSGDVQNDYTYNPFGETFSSELEENVTNSFRFASYFWDSETGYYYLINRYYEPHLYRFISHDLIDGKFGNPPSLHKYLYCGNEPVNRIDPWGLLYDDVFESPYLPWSDPLYDERKTQYLVDYATEFVGQSFLSPFLGAWGLGAHLDYWATSTKFTRDSAILTGSQFGNYLAGYTTYYNYGLRGEATARTMGHLYELFVNTGNEFYFDDPGSKFYISAGVLHALLDKGEKGLWGQLNEIVHRNWLYQDMLGYATSDVEGSDMAIEHGYLFWYHDN